jgi:Ribosomal protein L11 methyltransferase (PrmA)
MTPVSPEPLDIRGPGFDGTFEPSLVGPTTMSDVELSPDTFLQLAPGIRTRFDNAGHVVVDSPVGTIVDIGPRGFGILSRFGEPVRLGDVIEALERERDHWTDFAPTLHVLNMLIEESVLVSPGSSRRPTSGWSDPVEHARMLHDERRTGDYLAALGAAVRPDDVVLDIGTGSGVLAIAAVKAGARHVYAVEASDIADAADRVFALNGVRDRVTLIPGWSRQIELPEPADLLVAEIIGNEPLEEEILETTLDARRRLLKPGARMIPRALTLFVRPLVLPDAEIRQRTFGRQALDRWRALYDIDFTPLLQAAIPGPTHTVTEGEVVGTWPQAGPPVELSTIDLETFDEPSLHVSTDVFVDPPGLVNAIALTFRAELHTEIFHTLDPWRWPASSWATSVWVLPDPVEVSAESVLRVHYHRRVPEAQDGITYEVLEGQ